MDEGLPVILPSKRRYFRKKVSLPFEGSSLYLESEVQLNGFIKDISLGGAGLEVILMNSPVSPYRVGEEYEIKATLPNDKNIEFFCKLISVREGQSTDSLFLGVSITEISEHSSKNLGFFLMP